MAFGFRLEAQKFDHDQRKLYVAEIYSGGPAALSSYLAVNDIIDEINGLDPQSETAPALSKLLQADSNGTTPLWLRVQGRENIVCLLNHENTAALAKAISSKMPQDRKPNEADIGIITVAAVSQTDTWEWEMLVRKNSPNVGEEGRPGATPPTSDSEQLVVQKIIPGGSAWLHSQLTVKLPHKVLEVGDVITHVDGMPVSNNKRIFMGAEYSWIKLSGRSGTDDSPFEIELVRTFPLPNVGTIIQDVQAHRNMLATQPPTHASGRINQRSKLYSHSAQYKHANTPTCQHALAHCSHAMRWHAQTRT